MSEKRFELSEYSTVYRYSVIDNIQKGTLKANEIIILLSKQAEKIDEQQATINKLKGLNDDKGKRIISLIRTNKTLNEENEQLRKELKEIKENPINYF